MQIEKGLKADVFFSASTKQMNALVAEKLINKKCRSFIGKPARSYCA